MGKLTPENKCEIILQLQNNVKHVDLANFFGVSRQTIYNVEKVWNNERRITDLPKKRRPLTHEMKQIDKMVEFAMRFPSATLADLKSRFKLSYHLSTISTILRKHRLRTYAAKLYKPLTKVHKRNRVTFAKDHQNLNFDRVIFSDEKTVQNFFNGRVRVRRLRGQGWRSRNIVNVVSQNRSCKVNVWGYISKEKCDLFLVSNKFKSQEYKELLEISFLPEIRQFKSDFIFMQDNASIHKANIVMQYLAEEKLTLFNWPPKSPDLNPIENVWAEMQRLVNQHLLVKRINKPEALYVLCKGCFKIACEKMVDNLFKSMPNRLKLVVDTKGERTRY